MPTYTGEGRCLLVARKGSGPRKSKGAGRNPLNPHMSWKPEPEKTVAVPLALIPPQQTAVIVSLPPESELLRRLASYGFIPGVQVVVERNIPAFVVVIGATRIALDRHVATGILVQVVGENIPE